MVAARNDSSVAQPCRFGCASFRRALGLALGIGACAASLATCAPSADPIAQAPSSPLRPSAEATAAMHTHVPSAPVAVPRAADRPATELIDAAPYVPTALIRMRYASADNFVHATMYAANQCVLRAGTVAKLQTAAAQLAASGYRLLLWDCYRPVSVQQQFWEKLPNAQFVAPITRDAAGRVVRGGSKHNRGAAVDLGVVAQNGDAVPLPSAHDDFTSAASRSAARTGEGAPAFSALDKAMRAAGFTPITSEWWHYDDGDAAAYAFADVPLPIAD